MPNKISRLGHPAVNSTGLLNRAALGFRVRRQESTLSQRRCLPSYRSRGFLSSAKFEPKHALRALMWSTKCGTPRTSRFCLLLMYQGAPVARRRHLCRKHLLFPDIGACSKHPRSACIIRHRADELLIKQDTFPDGQITSLVQMGTQHTHSLSSSLFDMVDVRRPDDLYV